MGDEPARPLDHINVLQQLLLHLDGDGQRETEHIAQRPQRQVAVQQLLQLDHGGFVGREPAARLSPQLPPQLLGRRRRRNLFLWNQLQRGLCGKADPRPLRFRCGRASGRAATGSIGRPAVAPP